MLCWGDTALNKPFVSIAASGTDEFKALTEIASADGGKTNLVGDPQGLLSTTLWFMAIAATLNYCPASFCSYQVPDVRCFIAFHCRFT